MVIDMQGHEASTLQQWTLFALGVSVPYIIKLAMYYWFASEDEEFLLPTFKLGPFITGARKATLRIHRF
jgi:hypothetical protein